MVMMMVIMVVVMIMDNDTNGDGDYDDTGVDDEDHDDNDHNQWVDTSPSSLPLTGRSTGTPYDLTQGIAAGPYGDPTRFDGALNDNMTLPELLSGGYER